MGMLEEMAGYLESAGVGIFTPTTGKPRTIFLSHRPASPDTVLVLYEYARGARDFEGYKTPGLHIDVRGPPRNYTTPRALIESVINTLHGVANSTIGSSRYLVIQLLGEPERIDYEEDKSRVVLGCNFNIVFV